MKKNELPEKHRHRPGGQMIYALLKGAQSRFGKARFELGALLCEIKDRELWKGRAVSFAAFLEEERINTSAAYAYMRVARKLFNELNLSDREFDQLSTVNMGNLELASQIMTQDNKHQIIDILNILGERDAKQEMLEMIDQAAIESGSTKPLRSRQVNKAISVFYALPDDQRIEFLHSVHMTYAPLNGTASPSKN